MPSASVQEDCVILGYSLRIGKPVPQPVSRLDVVRIRQKPGDQLGENSILEENRRIPRRSRRHCCRSLIFRSEMAVSFDTGKLSKSVSAGSGNTDSRPTGSGDQEHKDQDEHDGRLGTGRVCADSCGQTRRPARKQGDTEQQEGQDVVMAGGMIPVP